GEWGMTRAEAIEYARTRGVPVPASADSPNHTDSTLWGRSIACGAREDPGTESEDIYALTRSPAECPDEPAYVEISFERGMPIAINSVEMPLVELVVSLRTIAGAHGIGRIDVVENRLMGVRSREIYESPAEVVLR